MTTKEKTIINKNDDIKVTALPYTEYINRPIGWFIAKHLLFLTPNQITVFNFIILLIAIFTLFLTFGTYWVFIPYLLLALNLVLDSTDGKVARLRGMSTKLGDWLDHSLDGLRILLLNAAFIILLLPFVTAKQEILIFLLFLPIITQTSHYIFASFKEYILQQRFGFILDQSKRKKRASIIRWLAAPIDPGIFCMITLIAFNPKWLFAIYVLYGFLFLLLLLVTSYISIKKYYQQ
jgi:phosphatidylglycerophosphate synthase